LFSLFLDDRILKNGGFMLGIFKRLKEAILPEKDSQDDPAQVDNLIALGVLLWVVAEADEKFLPEETEAIKEILRVHAEINQQDMSIVLRAVKEASITRIDLYEFAKEINQTLKREERVNILEHLFQVACADQDLDNEELEIIRKISGLLQIEHDQFISTKIKVKKDFGLEVNDI
jgi:uncharacterized tellurite resistance protein B-like protein